EIDNEFTMETEVQGPPSGSYRKKNLLLVKISSNGQIIAKKQIESAVSHYATYVSSLEDQSILIIGFKGNSEKSPQSQIFDVLINKDLNILYSSL
ncbi:MAG: hypothetical protein NZ521_04425, partial [Flammeovirgaceae bacterium]|nr:hypothetical protein [Flammeovirgaceae bacterium]MDW8287436.1 hypothetical protein [Flammeovirgaceae bacterium]